MSPIFQAIQPITSFHRLGFLSGVACDVAVDLLHVVVLIFGEVVLVGVLDVDDALA